MAKRTKSLIDDIANMEPMPKVHKLAWWEDLQKRSPEQYSEVIAVVDNFRAGGVVFDKLQSLVNLHRVLTERKVIPTISITRFREFYRLGQP